MKTFWAYIQFIILIIILIIVSLLVSWKISINTNIWNLTLWINQHTLTWSTLPKNLENKNINLIIVEDIKNASSDWLTFLSIFATLLAAFFIYSSWKIDNDLRKISDVKENIKKIEDEAINNSEFYIQLNYATHYMLWKQYNKALDALIILRAEPWSLKDSRRLNICDYFIAVCYYEQWLLENNIEYIAKAVDFINEAIESPEHPLKVEIIEKFNEMNNIEQEN